MMHATPAYLETKAFPDEPYLYIRIVGRMTMEQAREATTAVIIEGQKMRPGFSIINDISEARPTSPEIAEVIKKGQVALFAMGAVRVVRIIGSAGGASLQFSRTQRESLSNYDALTAPTLEHAIRLVKALGPAP